MRFEMLDLPVQDVKRFDLLSEGEEVVYVVQTFVNDRFEEIDIATLPPGTCGLYGQTYIPCTWHEHVMGDIIRVMRPVPSPPVTEE